MPSRSRSVNASGVRSRLLVLLAEVSAGVQDAQPRLWERTDGQPELRLRIHRRSAQQPHRPGRQLSRYRYSRPAQPPHPHHHHRSKPQFLAIMRPTNEQLHDLLVRDDAPLAYLIRWQRR